MVAGSDSRLVGGRRLERGGMGRRKTGIEGAAPARGVPAKGARWVAFEVLSRIFGRQGLPLEEAFADLPAFTDLSQRDRAFARLLVMTVLRRLGQIDAQLKPHLKAVPRSQKVLLLLRLGAAQLLCLGTPPHAALNETLRLATEDLAHFRPLLNAVLRRVAAGKLAEDGPEAARQNTPEWLLASWTAAYGEETALDIALAHLKEPPLDLQVKAEPEAWAEQLGAELLAGGTLRRLPRGMIEDLPGYDEGAWWVQDIAASLPARLLGAKAGDRVLDLCAAPGGKTMALAATGAQVTAVELNPDRAKLLRQNLARTGLMAEVLIADAKSFSPAAPAPFILLDAPCSATGTIRRHPDVAYRRVPADISRNAGLQDELLTAAAALLAPGGTLVYAVCSLQPEEGPARIAALLGREPALSILPVTAAELGGLPLQPTPEGFLRTLPCDLAAQGGMDGFFIARLRRAS